MKIIGEELDDVKIVYKTIEEWRDVDNAEGIALDNIGKNLMQFRGQTSDEIYRILIKSKVARNRATGTLNNMLEVLSLALDVDPSEIVIEQGVGKHHSISIMQVPLGRLAEVGLSITAFGLIVAKLVAGGVKVETIEFFGTFQYVEELENDIELGYADINMENGGTLGDLFQPETDPNFPL